MCLALRASGLWLRYATLQNLIPSFPWIAPPWPPPWRNPRKGRDQILPSGNLGVSTFKRDDEDEAFVWRPLSLSLSLCLGCCCSFDRLPSLAFCDLGNHASLTHLFVRMNRVIVDNASGATIYDIRKKFGFLVQTQSCTEIG